MLITIVTLYLCCSYWVYKAWQWVLPPVPAVLGALVTSLLLGLPVYNLPIHAYITGITGHLSISSFVLVAAHCLRPASCNLLYLSDQEQKFICRILAYSGLFLYPMTLGLTQFDPYILGYWQSFPHYFYLIIGLLMAISLLACYLRYHYVVIIFIGSLLGYDLHSHPSTNWWDYYIDPWIWFYACYFLIRKLRTTQ